MSAWSGASRKRAADPEYAARQTTAAHDPDPDDDSDDAVRLSDAGDLLFLVAVTIGIVAAGAWAVVGAVL